MLRDTTMAELNYISHDNPCTVLVEPLLLVGDNLTIINKVQPLHLETQSNRHQPIAGLRYEGSRVEWTREVGEMKWKAI